MATLRAVKRPRIYHVVQYLGNRHLQNDNGPISIYTRESLYDAPRNYVYMGEDKVYLSIGDYVVYDEIDDLTFVFSEDEFNKRFTLAPDLT